MGTDGKLGSALDKARQEAQLSQDELWAVYWQAGGEAKRSAILSYLRGQTEPQVSQYNVLAKVLNNRLRDLGKEALLPVIEFD